MNEKNSPRFFFLANISAKLILLHATFHIIQVLYRTVLSIFQETENSSVLEGTGDHFVNFHPQKLKKFKMHQKLTCCSSSSSSSSSLLSSSMSCTCNPTMNEWTNLLFNFLALGPTVLILYGTGTECDYFLIAFRSPPPCLTPCWKDMNRIQYSSVPYPGFGHATQSNPPPPLFFESASP